MNQEPVSEHAAAPCPLPPLSPLPPDTTLVSFPMSIWHKLHEKIRITYYETTFSQVTMPAWLPEWDDVVDKFKEVSLLMPSVPSWMLQMLASSSSSSSSSASSAIDEDWVELNAWQKKKVE